MVQRRGKPDANQGEIVEKLRALMISVNVQNGDFDFIVGYRRRNYLFETKNPTRPKSHDKRSAKQAKLRATWQGQYDTIETVDDVLRIIGWKDGDGEYYRPGPHQWRHGELSADEGP